MLLEQHILALWGILSPFVIENARVFLPEAEHTL